MDAILLKPLFIIVSGYILDLFFGDPRWMPHPVRLIGYSAKMLEPLFRRLFRVYLKLAGALFALLIVSSTWLIVFVIVRKVTILNNFTGFVLSIFLMYTSLSIKDLRDESLQVVYALESGNLELAREKLSFIVGRNTKNLSKQEILRATVETVAENIADGIIAPLFYAFIGGAPLALTYKAVNTLDSMVGYKNERYRDFGWASARLDDIVNFIPARISGVILPIASYMIGKNGSRALKIVFRDGRKNPSPNSGIPEAAIAGALGIQLGGLNFYNSVGIQKPYVGNNICNLEIKHVNESIKIAYISSVLFMVIGISLSWLTGRG